MTKAYKGFNADLSCLGFLYEVGKTYQIEGELQICKNAFHAADHLPGAMCYYASESGARYCEVELDGDIQELYISMRTERDPLDRKSRHTKYGASQITILRELTFQEMEELIADRHAEAAREKFLEERVKEREAAERAERKRQAEIEFMQRKADAIAAAKKKFSYKRLLAKANKELAGLDEFLEEHAYVTEPQNLKLHEASYEAWKSGDEDDMFGFFCETERMYLDEWCEQEFGAEFNKLVEQYGRTSSFQIKVHDDIRGREDRDCYLNERLEWNLCPDSTGIEAGIINEDDFLYMISGYTHSEFRDSNEVEILNYIAAGKLRGLVEDDFEDPTRLANYIRGIKENQVEIFRLFVEDQKENNDEVNSTPVKNQLALAA